MSAAVVADLVGASRTLCKQVGKLRFGAPVAYVYNPLEYARAPHERYLERYGAGRKRTVFLGMNPGPFGMAQTGVPFGDVALVRDFLGISGKVGRPSNEHPARPIQGFECPRCEVSGTRLWGWVKSRFGAPERFFADFFVLNYCPLVFMEESGRNRTPDKLAATEREALFAACDEALRAAIRCLRPERVVGVGGFAYGRAQAALEGFDLSLSTILHPSPASPAANRDWAAAIEAQLRACGALGPMSISV